MIQITNDKNVVKVKMSTSIDWTFTFNHVCSDEPYAIFLKRDLERKLGDLIEMIRQESYNEGWSDKSKKTRKRTWFSPVLRLLY